MNKRAPPENIDNYADYRFHLGYEKQDGDCLVDKEDLCRNAYQELVNSNCKSLQEGLTLLLPFSEGPKIGKILIGYYSRWQKPRLSGKPHVQGGLRGRRLRQVHVGR